MPPARAAFLSLALAFATATPVTARADQLLGTRFDIEEDAHVIEATLDRGFARLVVTRTLANVGPRSDQAVLHLDLPPFAVATRLRTSGRDPAGRPTWFEGDLMDAEEAAAKYEELTGFGLAAPKDPALLRWRSQGHLTLQVFPVPARGAKTVEYTLLLPMRYAEGGEYVLDLPESGSPESPVVLSVRPEHPEDRIRVNGVAVASGRSLPVDREVTLGLLPSGGPPVTAALAAVPLSEGRVFVHERAAAAPRLGEVPVRAAVAVVLDVSRSMSGLVDGELTAARAYLSRFRGAEVTIVAFDRTPYLPFGGPLSVDEAIARLSSYEPRLGNGSEVAAAVRRADTLLARSTRIARRMLVLTDLRTRETLSADVFASEKLASGAIVHVSTVDLAGTALVRDDQSPWARLPRRTGGVLWHASAGGGGALARDVFEEWARPKRIDRLRASGFPGTVPVPETLDEGRDLEFLGLVPASPGSIAVEGELWSSPVQVKARSTPEEEKLWSALSFGSDTLNDLSADEQRDLALLGHAVSPVTSFLAVEPGVRPSVDGLEPQERGIGEGAGGIGRGIGLGSIGSIGHGGGRAFDPLAYLERRLGRAWRACGGTGHAEVGLESSLAEVVDVGNVSLDVPSPRVAACVTSAAWSLDLPPDFASERETFTVQLGGG